MEIPYKGEYIKEIADKILRDIINKEEVILRPLFDRVLIKRDPLPEKKVGSIYLPDDNSVIKVSGWGKVIKIGHKCNTVKEGDRIYFAQFATYPTGIEEDLVLIKEDDILGIEDGR